MDATFVKVRDGGRVVSMAVVLGIGVRSSGEREVLGLDVGPSEAGAFRHQFLRSLVARGLGGVQVVISDAHPGLNGSIAAVLQGASWQRCRVHFVRHALGLVPKAAAEMVAATIRTVFAQPDPAMAREQWRKVADGFRARYPRLAALLGDAEVDVLAYLAFPASTGARSDRTTRSSASIRRSSAAPTSSASSPTRPPSSAWSAPS